MKRIHILIGGLIIIAIGIGVYALFHETSAIPFGTSNNPTDPFGPPAGSVPVPIPTPGGGLSSLSLTLQDGTSVLVPDFTKMNQPPTADAISGYQMAGSNIADFQILYYPENSGILISLFSESLGPVRLAAEEALRATLRLSDNQLCQLVIDVATTDGVSSTYSGQNLGLSFCPGATPLPK